MKYYNAIGNRPYSQREEWTDNGNGNYCKVHFRIDTNGFECMNGYFDKEDDRKAFYEAITNSTNIALELMGYDVGDETANAVFLDFIERYNENDLTDDDIMEYYQTYKKNK